MTRRFSLLAMLVGLLAVPSAAQAQHRGNRNAPAMTPYGPVYNPTQTPEWRQAGGNYAVWQQIMMQKMAAQEQAAFQKELAQYQKMLKAQGQKPPSGLANGQPMYNTPMPRRRVKKKPTPKPTTSAKEATKDDKVSTPKPISDLDEETTPTTTTPKPTTPAPSAATSTKPADSSK